MVRVAMPVGKLVSNRSSGHPALRISAACAPFTLLQACPGLEVDAASQTVRLNQPRLPQFLDSLVVRRLCVGESRLDLLFKRQESSVAVSLLSREGRADVEVVL